MLSFAPTHLLEGIPNVWVLPAGPAVLLQALQTPLQRPQVGLPHHIHTIHQLPPNLGIEGADDELLDLTGALPHLSTTHLLPLRQHLHIWGKMDFIMAQSQHKSRDDCTTQLSEPS